MGPPKRGDPHGGRVPVVLKRSGQCPIHGEGEQGCENVRDRMPEGVNRKGISGQGRLSLRPGEPDASKGACPVREGGVGNVPKSVELESQERSRTPSLETHFRTG
jgi:hypothetical protein